MTEQEATATLEDIVGSPDKCFRLMRIFQNAKHATSSNQFSLRSNLQTLEQVFRQKAKQHGYSKRAIQHYLNHIR